MFQNLFHHYILYIRILQMSLTKYFAFTLNNYDNEQIDIIQSFAKSNYCNHLIYGIETAPTTGTKHLQGCFCTKTKSRPLTIKNKIGLNEIHIEPCRKVYEANLSYCKKSGEIWQWPSDFIRTKKQDRQTYREAIELAKQGKFEEIEAEKLIKFENKFKKIFAETKSCQCMYLNNRLGNFFPEFFIFMHGPTGTGKSFRVEDIVFTLEKWWLNYCNLRNINHKKLGLYRKKCSKWWDGYLGEDIILIEELQPNWCLIAGSQLKVWLDQYVFSGEIKGGFIENLRPKFFILTSNYTLKQLFTKDDGKVIEEDYQPIKRRVHSITINNKNDNINWPNLDKLALYFDNIYNIRNEINNKFQSNFESRNQKFIEYEKQRNENQEEPPASITESEEEPILLESPSFEQNFECYYCEFNFEFNSLDDFREYNLVKKVIQSLELCCSRCKERISFLERDIFELNDKITNVHDAYRLLATTRVDGEIFCSAEDKCYTLRELMNQVKKLKDRKLLHQQEIQHNYNLYFDNLVKIEKYKNILNNIIIKTNKKNI